MDVQLIGSREFGTFRAAESFYDQCDSDGFSYVSTLTNVPRTGMYTVRWGHYVEPREATHDWAMRKTSEIFQEREDEAASTFTRACEGVGRQEAARQCAAVAGYTGSDAEMFEKGFCGWSAKLVNPRATGMEDIFRAGRKAWGSSDGQRLFRVESVRARSIVEPVAPRPFNPGCGLIANGES